MARGRFFYVLHVTRISLPVLGCLSLMPLKIYLPTGNLGAHRKSGARSAPPPGNVGRKAPKFRGNGGRRERQEGQTRRKESRKKGKEGEKRARGKKKGKGRRKRSLKVLFRCFIAEKKTILHLQARHRREKLDVFTACRRQTKMVGCFSPSTRNLGHRMKSEISRK